MSSVWELFTLLTGILYIILEIRQRNLMWVVGVLTALAAIYVFYAGGLYASCALNVYYLCVSFIGLWQWRRDSRTAREKAEGYGTEPEREATEKIRLRPITWRVLLVSLAAFVILTFVFGHVASLLGDPMSVLDVAAAVLSAIATWWLSRCYKEQWLLWIVADFLAAVLCASQQLWWMTALYAVYAMSAIYGYFHWKRHGYAIL